MALSFACITSKAASIICRTFTLNTWEKEIVVALDGTVLEGEKNFPKNKLKLLVAWMEIHCDDLEANWKLLSSGEQFFRIDPLK